MGFLEEKTLKNILLGKGKIEKDSYEKDAINTSLDDAVKHVEDLQNNNELSPKPSTPPTKYNKGNTCVEVITIAHGRVSNQNRYDYEQRYCFNTVTNNSVFYSDKNKCNPDPESLNHNILININGTQLEVVDLEEANTIYSRIKGLIVGRGNTHLVIKHGKVSSETIKFKG